MGGYGRGSHSFRCLTPGGRVPRKKGDSGEALPSDIPGWPLCGDSGLVWAPGGHCPMLWWGNGLQGAPLCPGAPRKPGVQAGATGDSRSCRSHGRGPWHPESREGLLPAEEVLLPCV